MPPGGRGILLYGKEVSMEWLCLTANTGGEMKQARFFTLENDSLSEIDVTHFEESEAQLEKWVKFLPSFVGENLVIIGEQLDFPSIGGDAIDIVGLDSNGAVVVIELKKGATPSDVDFQAIKYASYISNLGSEELGRIAAEFLRREENGHLIKRVDELGVQIEDDQVDLPQLLAAWFKRDVSEYAETINETQRIIIVAEQFDARIALALEWLRWQGVDITGVQYRQIEVGGKRILNSQQVLPAPEVAEAFVSTTRPRSAKPWKTQGKSWHMNKFRPEVAEAVERLLEALEDHIQEISWGQAHYFWLRGRQQNIRVLSYIQSFLDLGLHPASEILEREFLRKHPTVNLKPRVISGYDNSPFLRPTINEDFPGDEFLRMLTCWLDGEQPSKMP